MLESSQFLQILAAEAEHLVTVSIFLPVHVKSGIERRLNDGFASDSFSDAARAWNGERSRIVQEVLDQHLIPAGVKWAREYIREEVEDYLAAECGNHLRAVCLLFLYWHYTKIVAENRCSSIHDPRNDSRRDCICSCDFMGQRRPS